MANYLPVLMHSVTANVVPDDSSLETQPRGQVDYLSHDWREEDVWRSWRNMTRQKNEIVNGVRLENASWRTWWKQRNKLETVNPETLNWFKDSDVTWLYGPLHTTAVEWSPPPKPKDDTEPKPKPPHDHLDLSTPKQKSILKYRSISELLTSDFHPTSPVFSPAESENEAEDSSSSSQQRRPSLVHTKSDTHITRWGPDRTFRKDSPPRVEPPGGTGLTSPNSQTNSRTPSRVSSSTNLTGYFLGQNNNSQSSSSTSNSASASPRGGTSDLSPSSTNPPQKKKHIMFNTFVQQCIAIDKPKDAETYQNVAEEGAAAEDDGYVEDVGEDEYDADWGLNECAITDSDSEYDEEIFIEDDDDEDEDDENTVDYDDSVIEMRSSRHSKKNSCLKGSRSKSKASSSSSSSADSYSSSSKKPKAIPRSIRRRRSGTNGSNTTARPILASNLFKSSSSGSDHAQQQMMTIAPIAPTMLKTGSSNNYAYPGHYPAWDGFGMHVDNASSYGAWMDGFGDDGLSDDAAFGGPPGARTYSGYANGWRSSDSESPGTPVELVYMPPNGRYGSSHIGKSSSTSNLVGGSRVSPSVNGAEAEVEQMEEVIEVRQLGEDAVDWHVQPKEQSIPSKAKEEHHNVYHQEASIAKEDLALPPDSKSKSCDDSVSPSSGIIQPPLPVVVRTPPVVERPGKDSDEEGEEDAYDYFGGPDLGEDYTSRRHQGASTRKRVGTPGAASSRRTRSTSSSSPSPSPYEERGRSRSRSKSRTPSPVSPPTSITGAISVPGRNTSFDRGLSSPTHSSSSLLSPPQRGRGSNTNTSPESSSSRGRSSTRTSSTLSDRDRPRSHHGSPLGSLSPEGAIGMAYGVYANGRISDRERGRDRSSLSGSRGRDRIETRLSHSLSPEALGGATTSALSSPSSSTTGTPAHVPPPSLPSDDPAEAPESPGVSSMSSSQTITPSSSATEPQSWLNASYSTSISRSHEETSALQTSPTPSNSPVISITAAPQMISRTSSSKSPIDITQPHMSSPRTSYSTSSIDPSTSMPVSSSPNILPSKPLSSQKPSTPSSPLETAIKSQSETSTMPTDTHSPSSPTDESIVGKAVGIMSSARAYLGL